MKKFSPNHYERAFENWLKDNQIQYIAVDEHKRAAFGRSKIKSFDFLLYPPNQSIIIAEVKGRAFKGSSFARLAGFECWVTMDDVNGLANWKQIFGESHIPVFVFAYCMKNIDVDFDGRDVFDCDGRRYVFFALKLSDYCSHMKLRSPKWETVTLPADKFRQCAIQMQELLT
ncbi:HYExAFE family protein [Planctomycetota bacterium]